ncbi:hypothetical protein [Caenispirillum bisanense]|uniref:Uncharacterized protein n=1 Tax=Caenispirillum bisanense TaxID=414052 RepID=A0A286GH75_9PROT|nr:hypothetical protein [Caenispirillum bisanense]SOD94885.1 hypothetical protein SAMN05421508_104153 [Caenispirillum bisanense]
MEQEPNGPLYEAFCARCTGTNINAQTLLATDYLNHFNEIIMLLEMVPDMPDMLEECRAWEPKSYPDHFRDSSFSDRDLAVEAYEHVPARFKDPFEQTIGQMNELVTLTMDRMEEVLEDPEQLRARGRTAGRALQRLIDVASAIIHGNQVALHQDEIDQLMGI